MILCWTGHANSPASTRRRRWCTPAWKPSSHARPAGDWPRSAGLSLAFAQYAGGARSRNSGARRHLHLDRPLPQKSPCAGELARPGFGADASIHTGRTRVREFQGSSSRVKRSCGPSAGYIRDGPGGSKALGRPSALGTRTRLGGCSSARFSPAQRLCFVDARRKARRSRPPCRREEVPAAGSLSRIIEADATT